MHPGPGPLTLWLGTRARDDAAGIYRTTLDLRAGTLGPLVHAARLDRATFVAVTRDRRHLYALGARSVAAFRITDAGQLEPIDTLPCGGDDPAHLALDHTGGVVLVSNYGDGSLASFHVRGDGGLHGPISLHRHIGAGPNPDRQTRAHLHSAWPFPDNRHVAVCDLGGDTITIYALDPRTGVLTLHGRTFARRGAGPRHLAWSPDGALALVINELDQTVTLLRVDLPTGSLTPIEIVDIAPTGGPEARAGLTAAQIVVHPGGAFVYTSTRDPEDRGRDLLGVLALGEQSLQLIDQLPARVSIPRHMTLTPDGQWLLVAGMRSNTLQVFRVDPVSGRLDPHGQPWPCPAPSCIAPAAP
jgi:6-phosphogluconolactonase